MILQRISQVGLILLLAAGCASYYAKRSSTLPITVAMEASADPDISGGMPLPVSPTSAPLKSTKAEPPHDNDRLMIYNATMTIVVPDVAGTLDKLVTMTSKLKGYMQEMTGNSITLRIPAGRFNEAIQTVETMGEVTSRQIKGADVTEEMRDYDIRLKNMEQVRERLLKLLDKGDKVEDLLKVSKELERVTEEIELLKGKIQFLQNQIAYSTLNIQLNSPLPQREQAEIIPFAWVRSLTTDIISTSRTSFVPERRMFSWLKFDLPSSYVKLEEHDNVTRAMSGDGVMLLIKREQNFEGGTLDFWSQIVRRWVTGSGVVAIAEEKSIALKTGAKAKLFIGTKAYGRRQYAYWVALVVKKDFIYTFECWGTSENVAKDHEALDKTLKSMRIAP